MFSQLTLVINGVPVLNYHAMKTRVEIEVKAPRFLICRKWQWSTLLPDCCNSADSPHQSVSTGQETRMRATDCVNAMAKDRMRSPTINRIHIQTAATHVSELHRITAVVCINEIIQIYLIIIFVPSSLNK